MKYALLLALCAVFVTACGPSPEAIATQTVTATTAVAAAWTKAATATLTPSPTSTNMPTPTETPTHSRSYGDLNIHTTCSDGKGSYEEMVEASLRRGVDFVAITDRRFGGLGTCYKEYECYSYVLCDEVLEKCRKETRLLCIPGMEVSGRAGGHLLALGIQRGINARQPLKAQTEEIHQQGGLAIAAHPFTSPWRYTEDELVHSGLDAMECGRGTPEENKYQLELAQKHNIPCVYNSDAHNVEQLGWISTVCDAQISSLADLKAALQGKKCTSMLIETPTPSGSRGDLHMHTTCSDGEGSYEEMVETSLELGLRFVAITDHNSFRPDTCYRECDDALCDEVIEKCRKETRLLCIPGMELSGRVHLLALGIQRGINAQQPLKAQVEEIHQQGGLAIAAHPFTYPWLYTEDELLHSGLDAMDCAWAGQTEQYGIPCVSSIDVHSPFDVAPRIVCDVPIKSLEDLKAALKGKKCHGK